MDYLNVWKKKMQSQGNTETEARLNNSKEFFIRNFKSDPSYKKAILGKLDLTEEPIDIRIKNIDKSTSEKRIIFLPNSQIEIGSYVKVADKTYLVKEFEDNSTAPYSKALLCNQTLNWLGLDEPIPCWCDNSSYGTKGVIDTNYLNKVDGKIVYYVQYNEKTKQIKQDMRFLFNHDEKYVYQVVDINNVVTGNVLRLVMDKAEFDPINDDVENNIAYNKWLVTSDEPPTGTEDKEYLIKAYTGLHEIHKYDSNVFTICNLEGVEDSGVWDIKIDYNSNPSDVGVLEEVTSNSIMLRNNGYIGIEIILNFTKGDITVSQTVRLVR